MPRYKVVAKEDLLLHLACLNRGAVVWCRVGFRLVLCIELTGVGEVARSRVEIWCGWAGCGAQVLMYSCRAVDFSWTRLAVMAMYRVERMCCAERLKGCRISCSGRLVVILNWSGMDGEVLKSLCFHDGGKLSSSPFALSLSCSISRVLAVSSHASPTLFCMPRAPLLLSLSSPYHRDLNCSRSASSLRNSFPILRPDGSRLANL